MKKKAINKKQFTPTSSQPKGLPQQMKPLKEILFELNAQMDNIKSLYNNLILQQEQKIQQLIQKEENK